MDDANGMLKDASASKASKPAAGVNGAIKTTPLNRHAGSPINRTVRAGGSGMLARAIGVVGRLLTWYTILTIVFRCPATLDACNESSPRICEPYFRFKQAVAPHLEPYYDAYAEPYVDLVRPYYDALDRAVITPTWSYAKRHGAPRLHQAHAFGSAHWEKSIQPRITKVGELAKAQYAQSLAPHINQVSATFAPYYDIARTNTLQTYHGLLLPAWRSVQPYMRQGYHLTSTFTSNTVVPSCIWAWNKTYVFLDATVWPQLRAMYVENVEPQLVKIGKRLGRYSSGKKSVPKPPTDSSSGSSTKTTTLFTKPALSASVTPSISSTTTVHSSTPAAHTEGVRTAVGSPRTRSTMEPVPPPEVDEKLESEDPTRRTAREIVAADLKDWQERYAKAADEGAAEIDGRVQEIAKRMLRRNARITGRALLEQLQEAAVSELAALRRDIMDIVGAVNKGSATPEEGQEQLIKAIRQAGMAVKAKAQAVRTWRENYEAEMQDAITKAAETHFTILENIRDLALQKIGMKWAWMDGVTYKDWAKYHLLKNRFDEWKGDLENHIVSHPSLEAAQIEGANIEDEAMSIAASTAKELGRLKQVANWKLIAGDDTPEFDSTLMQQAAEAVGAANVIVDMTERAANKPDDAVGDQLSEDASHAAQGLDTGTRVLERLEETQDGVQSSESGTALSQPPTPLPSLEAEETASPGFEAISSGSGELSSVIEPTSAATPDVEGTASGSDKSVFTDNLAMPDVASSVLFEGPVIVDNATESTEDVPEPAKLTPEDVQRAEEDDVDTAESSTTGLPVADATSLVKPAFLGAAAQSVPTRRPVLDDDTLDDVSSAMESMRRDLKSAYSAAMSRANEQYSQALSIVSAQVRGTPEPAHERMLASVTSAYSKAMASASSRLDDALRAASSQLQGTTTASHILPTTRPKLPDVDWALVESVAAERLQQGRAWAEEQYESAKIAIGLATPTPSTPAEHVKKLLDNAKHNYYANLGVAHARYSEFIDAASSAFSSMTASPTPTDVAGSASSLASVASGSVASVASAVSEGASSAMAAASAGASSAASAAGEQVSAAAAAGYSNAAAAKDKVADSWDAVITKISVQVYGAPTPTPWYSSVYSAAADLAASATSAACDGATPAYQEAAKHYSAASSIVSELIVGKEPAFTESVFSRLSAAYATGASSVSSVADAARETAAAAIDQAGEAARSVGDTVASAAGDAAGAVKERVSSIKDEL